jgi:hypothetical protein
MLSRLVKVVPKTVANLAQQMVSNYLASLTAFVLFLYFKANARVQFKRGHGTTNPIMEAFNQNNPPSTKLAKTIS